MLGLKNEFILAPLKLGYCKGDGFVNNRHLAFYSARATYLGAVTLEPLYLDSGLREIPTQLGIDSDDKIEGLNRLVGIIHKTGTRVIAHLSHPGRMANPKIPGNYFLSSTNKPCENGGAVPLSMAEDDMEKVKKKFVEAAERAKNAGFDIIELQFGHGYLFAQFISMAVNDRQDNFGGSFENRTRFPLTVLKAVREAVDLPIIVRISGDEMIPNGIRLQEMITLSKILQEQGVRAVHVSAGTVCSTPPWFFQHMFIPKGKTWEMAAALKKELHIPVIFVGRIHSAQDIERVRNELKADYVAIGRALVADPDFVGKYLGEVPDIIRPCLACSEGCLGGVKTGKGLHCVVNPLVGNEFEPQQPAARSKHYAVVGGGLAGMEAAITLKSRGHRVDLYEKDRLGGQFNLAWLPPHKESLKEIIDYFLYEIKKNKINVILKEADKNDLTGKDYQGVIVATGALPDIPPIEGLREYYWAEFLLDENLPEFKKVVVIGGGLIGTEIASKLIDNNNQVIIVEMLSEMARGMEMIEKALTLKKLKIKQVPIYTNYKVNRIDGDKIFLSGEKEIVISGVDKIVVATGMKSLNTLGEKLRGKIPVWVVGDAKEVGKAQDAIRSGYEVAKDL